ncbi:hypothetical protein AAVH_35260 [Aphelenchoides avenae]|nr:hypothetical protein AAVH_35260 [Aphelenchus avenae]
MKLCSSFAKNCPEEASKASVSSQPEAATFREQVVPLIIPPSLPSAPEETQFDLPLPTGDKKASETIVGRPLQAHQLSVAMIRTW